MRTPMNRARRQYRDVWLLVAALPVVAGGLLFALARPWGSSSQATASPQKAAHAYSFTWPYKKYSITPVDGQMQFRLDDPGSGADYALGIKAIAGASPWLAAGSVTYGQSVSAVLRPMSGVTDWPASEMKLGPGVAEFWGISRAKGSLMLYAVVPTNTHVSVITPSGTIASEVIQTSLLIYQGTILPVAVAGMQTLGPVLMHPAAMPNSKELVALPSGTYVATPLGLGKHLISLVRPSYPGGAPAADGTSAQLVLFIDEGGSVANVDAMGGDHQAVSAAEAAVRQWRFRPFLAGGSAVAVRAPVLFVFSKDGTVWSPVFTEVASAGQYQ